MRRSAWTALALTWTACSFPEYGFEAPPPAANTSCDAEPCQNDGTCVPLDDGGYACLCDQGFSGRDCETNVDDCPSAACLNGATCLDGVDDYTCDCAEGFSGRHCEENLDDCSPNPCQNGGTCIDGISDYVCECPDGSAGETCGGQTYRTCREILDAEPETPSGVYAVDPDGPGAGRAPVNVYCDMTRDDAAWMLVGRESVGSQGTFRFLAEEEGVASQIAEGSGDGFIGPRFVGLYTDVRFRWHGAEDGFIAFAPEQDLFVNEVDLAIPIGGLSSSDEQLRTWIADGGGAVFCRASLSLDVRPGDTSWAVKPANDPYEECGCNSPGWLGRGAFYGGNSNPTSCTGWGGGWAAVRGDGEQKGGILDYELELWIR